ncbi:MAG: hypothetical protein KKG64_03915, partial [Firmicutes bacterium]|nr:hypothetical protein [Bacillota bacterium]
MEINNFEKLVKIVTENIIGKISIDADPIINEKSCLILIPNIGLGFKDYFTYIRSNYPEYDLYLASNEESFNIHYIEKSKNIHFVKYDIKHSGFVNLLDAVETIIILGMKVNQMKALIETDDLEDVNHIILSSLMASKSIN